MQSELQERLSYNRHPSYSPNERVNMVPSLVFLLHVHKGGLMGERPEGGLSPAQSPANTR